ncbi:hypothetical protein LguiA_016125 [Lonicera macranthoides]
MQMMSGNMFSIPSSIKGLPQEQDSNPNPNNPKPNSNPSQKKKRNLPGNPDPDSEVIALSPKTLMATNRFVCEICNKGFQRDQNLQLHRRGHNLPWKLKQRSNKEVIKKKVYICPEKTCVHHDPSRALGDLTGIKKHFSRKHGEKKWKCEKCAKKYAVQSDWKAHSKTCGTREYKCDCGTLFSRKDSFITHRAFCDALAEESVRFTSSAANNLNFRDNSSMNDNNPISPQLNLPNGFNSAASISQFGFSGDQQKPRLSLWLDQAGSQLNPMDQMGPNSNPYMSSSSTCLPEMVQMPSNTNNPFGPSSLGHFNNQLAWTEQSSPNSTPSTLSLSQNKGTTSISETINCLYSDHQNNKSNPPGPMSATALLQKAAQMGSTRSNPSFFGNSFGSMNSYNSNSSSPSFNVLSQQNRSNENELNQVFRKQAENLPAGEGTMERVRERELTRDFLGMGGEGGRPLLPQEIAKLASMGSSGMGMRLSQFNSNH